jgi:thioredoxin-related protein
MEKKEERHEETNKKKEPNKEAKHKTHEKHRGPQHENHKEHKEKPHKAFNYGKVINILIIVLAALLLFNLYSITKSNLMINEKLEEQLKANAPAKLQLIIIKDSNCKDCFDISKIVSIIKARKTEIVKENVLEFSSAKAKTLIKRYDIEKIPTVIVAGEIEKATPELDKAQLNFKKQDNAMVFIDVEPPYIDTESNDVKGIVSLTYIKDINCNECSNMSNAIEFLKKSGVIIKETEELEWTSKRAKELIKKYDIKKIPTLILSEDAGLYDSISSFWSQVGSIEDDNYLVLRTFNPPYVDVSTGRTLGLVSMILLTDKTCIECYNVSIHKDIITNERGFNVKLKEEIYYDISSVNGKELLNKYNITQIPTIILSEDADEYPRLKQVWAGVGTIEQDGSYVFRNLKTLKVPYKDLTTNKIINNTRRRR